MLSRSALENAVHALMEQEVGVLLDVVPYAGHLISDREEINEAYYLRHRIETVKRIRMTSRTDALALASMVEEDYEAARWWSRYIAAELDHDRLYLRDLRRHGYLPENVAEIEPFPATVAMVHYIEESIRHAGSLAAVAYSVCVEWNSARASAAVVQKAERQFSEAHVLGARYMWESMMRKTITRLCWTLPTVSCSVAMDSPLSTGCYGISWASSRTTFGSCTRPQLPGHTSSRCARML